jgi:hypothetical protein
LLAFAKCMRTHGVSAFPDPREVNGRAAVPPSRPDRCHADVTPGGRRSDPRAALHQAKRVDQERL